MSRNFKANAFGAAESTMREFYDIMSSESAAPHLTTDLIGSLYAKLGEARSLTTDVGDSRTYQRSRFICALGGVNK